MATSANGRRERAQDAGSAQPYPSVVNDPVRAERALQRFEFIRSRPPVSADRALVFMTASGESVPYLPNHQPTRGELVGKNFRTLYEVEMAYQHLAFEHRLPSNGDAFFFHAETDVTWRVVKPGKVVEKGVRDVRALLEPRLLARMRQETRRFAIEQSAAAESSIQDALTLSPLTEAEGLEVTCTVRLSLDQTAIEQHSALRGVDYAKEHAQREHELVRLRTFHQQELTQSKTQFYASMLELGDIDRWALHLSANPQDIPLALQGIRDEEREAVASKLRIFERLLDADALEPHMLEEAARMAAETIRESLSDTAAGKTRKKPLYREKLDAVPLEKGRGEPEDQE